MSNHHHHHHHPPLPPPLPVPSHRGSTPHFAPVLWWERYLACVQCPFCHGIHVHILSRGPPFQGQFHFGVNCAANPRRESYVLLYPWERHHGAEGRAWEFDRGERTFRAVAGFRMSVGGGGRGVWAGWGSRQRSATTDNLIRMVGILDMAPAPGRQFAFATLTRGGNFMPVSAFGGWDFADCGGGVLDPEVWGRKARALSACLGCDREGGRGAAHVERQLAAYYLDRHVVRCDFQEMLGDREIEELAVVQPELPARVEIRVIGDGVCEGCEEFFLRLNAVLREFGTTIWVRAA